MWGSGYVPTKMREEKNELQMVVLDPSAKNVFISAREKVRVSHDWGHGHWISHIPHL